MRHETAGVTEILLESAKKEFLEYGFYEASLRRIATKSEVSTNSIYTRFHDKTGLFNAVVKEAADGLMEIYLKSVNEARKTLDVEQAMQIGGEGTDIVLKHIYKYKDEFKLILCSSDGTKYENIIHDMAEIEVDATHKFAKTMEQLGYPKYNVDKTLEHILASGLFSAFFEVIIHDIPHENAAEYLEELKAFYTAGWKKIMGF